MGTPLTQSCSQPYAQIAVRGGAGLAVHMALHHLSSKADGAQSGQLFSTENNGYHGAHLGAKTASAILWAAWTEWCALRNALRRVACVNHSLTYATQPAYQCPLATAS